MFWYKLSATTLPKLYVYDTLSHNVKEFVLDKHKKYTFYLCGPTVYDEIHIGNTRPIFVFDLILRIFEYFNLQYTYFQNITDISEKILNKAKKENTSEQIIAKKYSEKYLVIMKKLNVVKPKKYIYCSDTINEMINWVELLINENKAYVIPKDGVYFNIDNAFEYGLLSNINIAKNYVVDNAINKNKRNLNDFALWKFKNTDWYFKTPFGNGIPGWHTECVVMANMITKDNHYLDFHGGGKDLIFPHHENEIAQHKVIYKNNLANVWVHVGQIQYQNQKMAKSTGNIIYVKNFINDYSVNILKFCILNSNYRKPLNINDNSINTAIKQLKKWSDCLNKHESKIKINKNNPQNYLIIEPLLNNLNVPILLKNINDLVKKINIHYRNNTLSKTDYSNNISAVKLGLWFLGIEF